MTRAWTPAFTGRDLTALHRATSLLLLDGSGTLTFVRPLAGFSALARSGSEHRPASRDCYRRGPIALPNRGGALSLPGYRDVPNGPARVRRTLPSHGKRHPPETPSGYSRERFFGLCTRSGSEAPRGSHTTRVGGSAGGESAERSGHRSTNRLYAGVSPKPTPGFEPGTPHYEAAQAAQRLVTGGNERALKHRPEPKIRCSGVRGRNRSFRTSWTPGGRWD